MEIFFIKGGNTVNELITTRNTQVVASPVLQEINEIFDCTANTIQLNEIEQQAVVVNFNSKLYIVAAEIIWRRTIDILRDRLSFFGEEFIGDMLGYDKPIMADNISEQEAIELNCDVGFLKQNAKMELLHHAVQIKQYTSRQYQMVEKINITKNQAMALISDCIQYVLSDMTECTMLEFNNVRQRIKSELFTLDSDIITLLKQGQYFAKRTILRSLMNMAKTNKEEEKQFVFHNMSIIVPVIWNDLAETDKYSFGTTYAEISSTDKKDYINVVKKILYNVHGFDYVPENLKSNSFKATAKNLNKVHDALNNFYNEPLAAKLLSSMGTMIPDPAVYDCINSVLICITGNEYGVSRDAQPYLQEVLNGMTIPKWELYLKDLSKNTELLRQIAFVNGINDSVPRWCEEVRKRNLNQLNFSEHWIMEFLLHSANCDYDVVRTMAKNQYCKINNISA